MTHTAPDVRVTALDRVLVAVGLPGLALRRVAGRYSLDMLRAYVQAAKTDRTTGTWRTVGVEMNDVTASDAAATRQRARGLVLNNAYAIRARQVIVDNVVQSGISTQSVVEFSRDPTENEALNTRMESRKSQWMKQADANGVLHWHDMQRLILAQVVEAGGILVRRRYLTTPGRVLPLAFELLEVDRLTELGTVPAAGNEVIQGVEVLADTAGPVVAYHVDVTGGYSRKVVRIPADQVCHVYRVDRPNQVVGLSWFAPIMPDLYLLADIKEYALIARKVQSALSVIVSDNPNTGGLGMLPGLGAASGASTANAAGDAMRYLEPGMIHRVGQGHVTAFTPAPTGDLDPLTKLVLRGVGVGWGLSYEWISGDYKEVSFAGGRLSGQDSWQTIEPIHAWFCRKLDEPVHRDWVNAETSFGEFRRPRPNADPYACKFSRPRRGWGVNPLQEVNAATAAIDAGLSTIRDEVESRGGDAEEVWKQIEAEIARGDRLGLVLYKALRGAPDPSGAVPGADGSMPHA